VRLRLINIVAYIGRSARFYLKGTWLLGIFPNLRLSNYFGADRGTPVDRVLMMNYLEKFQDFSMNGEVLEFADSNISDSLFPNAEKYIFIFSEGVRPQERNNFEIVGDLNLCPDDELLGKFKCIISTQVLAFTKNPFLVADSLILMLSDGGKLIGTEPFMSKISQYDDARWGDYFRFTAKGLEAIFANKSLRKITKEICPLGNYRSTQASSQGLVKEDRVPLESYIDDIYTLVGYSIQVNEDLS